MYICYIDINIFDNINYVYNIDNINYVYNIDINIIYNDIIFTIIIYIYEINYIFKYLIFY